MTKKKWEWAISTYVLVNQTHEEIIEIFNHVGVSSLEVGMEALANFGSGMNERQLENIRRHYQTAGININSFHLPFHVENDVTSFYETIRRQAVEKMEVLFEDAARLGCATVIMHPGPPSKGRYSVEVEGLDKYLSAMGRSLEVLLPRAEKLGLDIALENLGPSPYGYSIGAKPEHFTKFLEKFSHPNFGFCLDTGHALIAGGPEGPAKFFTAMERGLKAFHLADNAGDRDSHLAPGRGLIDWRMLFSEIARINFTSPLCIEAPPFSHAEPGTGRYSLSAWKELIEETDKLDLYGNL